MCPLADMANHSHAEVCAFHFISQELHPSPDPSSSYYSHEKYLCDVRLVTGTPKDQNLNKILRGDSVKDQEAASGSLS
jgi:hypothetical protein